MTTETNSDSPVEPMKPDGIRRGIFVYEKSPFMTPGAVTSKTKRITNKTGDMMLVSGSTGEIINPIAGIWTSKKVDAAKFVKLYVGAVKQFSEMSGSGTKLFEVLYHEIQNNPGKDQVILSWYQHKEISLATWKRGMAELTAKSFIAATPTPNLFWINPQYVFNGDRLAFVQTYYRESAAGQAEENSAKQLTIFDDQQPA